MDTSDSNEFSCLINDPYVNGQMCFVRDNRKTGTLTVTTGKLGRWWQWRTDDMFSCHPSDILLSNWHSWFLWDNPFRLDVVNTENLDRSQIIFCGQSLKQNFSIPRVSGFYYDTPPSRGINTLVIEWLVQFSLIVIVSWRTSHHQTWMFVLPPGWLRGRHLFRPVVCL